MSIILPGDKQPSPEQKFQQFVRAQFYNQEMSMMNLMNNFVALKNILNVSDKQMEAEFARMNEEIKAKEAMTPETKDAISKLTAGLDE